MALDLINHHISLFFFVFFLLAGLFEAIKVCSVPVIIIIINVIKSTRAEHTHPHTHPPIGFYFKISMDSSWLSEPNCESAPFRKFSQKKRREIEWMPNNTGHLWTIWICEIKIEGIK